MTQECYLFGLFGLYWILSSQINEFREKLWTKCQDSFKLGKHFPF